MNKQPVGGAMPDDQRRRRLLFGAVAAGAGLAGAAAALWRLRTQSAGLQDDGLGELWTRSFETPQGASLAMESFRGRPLLINFWATWCPPCIEEMPLLDAFYREHRASGWQVLGLAVDQAASVRTFLQRSPMGFPIGLAGSGGAELSRSLGNLAGGLPFSLAVGRDGRVRQRRMGQLTAEHLRQWATLG